MRLFRNRDAGAEAMQDEVDLPEQRQNSLTMAAPEEAMFAYDPAHRVRLDMRHLLYREAKRFARERPEIVACVMSLETATDPFRSVPCGSLIDAMNVERPINSTSDSPTATSQGYHQCTNRALSLLSYHAVTLTCLLNLGSASYFAYYAVHSPLGFLNWALLVVIWLFICRPAIALEQTLGHLFNGSVLSFLTSLHRRSLGLGLAIFLCIVLRTAMEIGVGGMYFSLMISSMREKLLWHVSDAEEDLCATLSNETCLDFEFCIPSPVGCRGSPLRRVLEFYLQRAACRNQWRFNETICVETFLMQGTTLLVGVVLALAGDSLLGSVASFHIITLIAMFIWILLPSESGSMPASTLERMPFPGVTSNEIFRGFHWIDAVTVAFGSSGIATGQHILLGSWTRKKSTIIYSSWVTIFGCILIYVAFYYCLLRPITGFPLATLLRTVGGREFLFELPFTVLPVAIFSHRRAAVVTFLVFFILWLGVTVRLGTFARVAWKFMQFHPTTQKRSTSTSETPQAAATSSGTVVSDNLRGRNLPSIQHQSDAMKGHALKRFWSGMVKCCRNCPWAIAVHAILAVPASFICKSSSSAPVRDATSIKCLHYLGLVFSVPAMILLQLIFVDIFAALQWWPMQTSRILLRSTVLLLVSLAVAAPFALLEGSSSLAASFLGILVALAVVSTYVPFLMRRLRIWTVHENSMRFWLFGGLEPASRVIKSARHADRFYVSLLHTVWFAALFLGAPFVSFAVILYQIQFAWSIWWTPSGTRKTTCAVVLVSVITIPTVVGLLLPKLLQWCFTPKPPWQNRTIKYCSEQQSPKARMYYGRQPPRLIGLFEEFFPTTEVFHRMQDLPNSVDDSPVEQLGSDPPRPQHGSVSDNDSTTSHSLRKRLLAAPSKLPTLFLISRRGKNPPPSGGTTPRN